MSPPKAEKLKTMIKKLSKKTKSLSIIDSLKDDDIEKVCMDWINTE